MTSSPGPPDPLYVLRGCSSPVTSLLFPSPSPGEEESWSLVSGTQDGRLDVWDVKTWRSVYTAQLHGGHSVLSLYERRDKPGVILSQGRDGTFQEINLHTQSVNTMENLECGALGFCQVCWMEVNNELVVVVPGSNSSQLDLYTVEDQKHTLRLVPQGGPREYGMCMVIRHLPGYLLVGYEDGSLSIWDLRTGRERDHVKLHSDSVMAMDYHPSVNSGVSGSADDQLVMWRVSDGQTIETVRERRLTNPGVASLTFREDGRFIVSGGWDGRVRLYGSKKGRPLAVLNYHQQTVQCLSFSPGGLLAVGSKDKHISFWSLYR